MIAYVCIPITKQSHRQKSVLANQIITIITTMRPKEQATGGTTREGVDDGFLPG